MAGKSEEAQAFKSGKREKQWLRLSLLLNCHRGRSRRETVAAEEEKDGKSESHDS